ncbi:cytochrome c peroxidase [Nitratiruptor sp. YY09-18]|nr:cytochrome c peroxidase [Nitratiruptor sp. YY09-18]
MQRLQNSTLYQPLFQKLFHTSAITIDQVAIAIAEYEKSLITPDCKFDRFLRGETKLTEKEYNGYILFKKLGCATCHNGVNIGGNSYQKIGIFYPYKGKALDDRYKITKDPKDRYVYKVPTLRNIALTAPYFHDGSVKDLRNAIKLMAIYNLGVKLNDKQVDLLESFLLTLTGKVPTQ